MKTRTCSECPETFEPVVFSQLTCGEKCAAARRRRKHAEWQRAKYYADKKWRERRYKKGYQRIKRRAKSSGVSIRKLRTAAAE